MSVVRLGATAKSSRAYKDAHKLGGGSMADKGDVSIARPCQLPLLSSTTNTVGSLKRQIPLTVLRKIYKDKDFLTHNFLSLRGIQSNGRFISLLEIKEHNQQKRYAQYLNLINTMNRFAEERKLEMAFVTVTLKSNRFDKSNVACVKDHSLKLRNIHKGIKDDRLFREPTEARKKKLGMITGWYYIPKNKFQYIYSLEFQKDLTLHSHCAYYIPNKPEAFISFYEVFTRKHKLDPDIGRCEFVIPNKYKEYFFEAFRLEQFIKLGKDCYIEKGTDTSKGDFLYIKFINDEQEYQNNYYKQVMLYISKYVMKGLGLKSDGSGTDRENDEDILIRSNKLRMISYSRTLAPFFIYNKFIKELKVQGIDLYQLTKMIQSGEAEYSIEYKDREVIEEEPRTFKSLKELDDYINYLEIYNLAKTEYIRKLDDDYIYCYENNIDSPTLTLLNHSLIENVQHITLKTQDKTFEWENKKTGIVTIISKLNSDNDIS